MNHPCLFHVLWVLGAKLRELYVRSNTIASLKELQHVRGSLCLRVLWLSDNPCADDADYRMHAIQMLPQLHVLDGVGKPIYLWYFSSKEYHSVG